MTHAADALVDLAARLGRVAEVQRDVDSRPLTTYRAGGSIALLAVVPNVEVLLRISAELRDVAVPVVVIGRGSNLLVRDEGFAGVALALGGEFESVRCEPEGLVSAGGACPLPVVARQSAAAGLRGLEFYVGIPGSVGGAVRMNAGGHGRETIDVLVEADVLRIGDDTPVARDRTQLGLAFRHSDLRDDDIVVGARFRAEPGDAEAARAEIDEVVRWRRAHQPGGQNCGSVFVNPAGDSAGRLVDSCGLKGRRVGGASVSDKHANFIQADPGTRAADIIELIEQVREAVACEHGIVLRTELRVLGGPPQARGEMRA